MALTFKELGHSWYMPYALILADIGPFAAYHFLYMYWRGYTKKGEVKVAMKWDSRNKELAHVVIALC